MRIPLIHKGIFVACALLITEGACRFLYHEEMRNLDTFFTLVLAVLFINQVDRK